MFIRQPVNTQLAQKYDKKFNFFFAKPISEVVFNRTIAPATLDFKDIVVYSETNEYLKRLYYIKNNAGRNEIYDRIRMLAEFYCGAAMLKYQHPMMIITKTKDVFLKRVKRMKKMIASDCSSQESSEPNSEHSSQIQSFSSSRFLRTIKTSELDQSLSSIDDSLIKNCGKKEKSFDSQVHDIYEKSSINFNENGKQKLTEARSPTIKDKSQIGLEHLIVDIDDVDKQVVVKQYTKVQERQNLRDGNKKKGEKLKKSSIIITALDHYAPADKQSQSSGVQNYYPKNSKYMKKQPSSYRYKEQDDQTIRFKNYSNLGSREFYNSRNFKPLNPNRSPSFGVSNNFQRKSTERNLIASPSYMSLSSPYEPSEQKRLSKDRIYNQIPSINEKAMASELLARQEHETIYLTQENSLCSKVQKKQYIRDKATALLQKVKSEQNLPIFYEEDPRMTVRLLSRNRGFKFQ